MKKIRKRKVLDLTDECIQKITIKAAKSGKVFKPFAEAILENSAKQKDNG